MIHTLDDLVLRNCLSRMHFVKRILLAPVSHRFYDNLKAIDRSTKISLVVSDCQETEDQLIGYLVTVSDYHQSMKLPVIRENGENLLNTIVSRFVCIKKFSLEAELFSLQDSDRIKNLILLMDTLPKGGYLKIAMETHKEYNDDVPYRSESDECFQCLKFWLKIAEENNRTVKLCLIVKSEQYVTDAIDKLPTERDYADVRMELKKNNVLLCHGTARVVLTVEEDLLRLTKSVQWK